MAGGTIAAHNIHLMDKSASECTKAVVGSVVTGRTVLLCCYMTQRLALADITVMAGQAVAGICTRVVKRRTGKAGGVMAYGAILVGGTGRYVIR